MKIVYINSFFGRDIIGGAEKITWKLAQGMVKLGHIIYVICLSDDNEVRVSEADGIWTICVPNNNIYPVRKNSRQPKAKRFIWHFVDSYNIKNSLMLERIISYIKPDVVHFHNLAGISASFISRLSGKTTLVATIHDYYFSCPGSTMYKNDQNCPHQCFSCCILTLPRRILSNRVDIVCGVSSFTLNKLTSQGYFGEADKIVINNAVDNNVDIIKYMHEKDILKIGFIGRVTKEKGVLEFLDVLIKLIRDGCRDFICYIAGDGDKFLVDAIVNLQEEYDNIRYLSVVSPTEFYEKIDLLIVPSLWNDPYPTVILEAYSYGVPAIGRCRGGITELIAQLDSSLLFDTELELEELIKEFLDYGSLKRKNMNNFKRKALQLSIENNEKNWINKYEAAYNKHIDYYG